MNFTKKGAAMLKTISAIGISILCCTSVSNSQSSGSECGKVRDDGARLECYDLLFKVDRVSNSPADEGKWRVTEDVSKFDDTRKVFIRLTSEDKHPGRFGGQESSYLAIACRENTTSLWMTFAGSFMSSDAGDGTVTYRIDSEASKKRQFRESNDNSALGLWNGGSSIPFIKGMIGKDKLVVRATPFSESSVTATYDIRGLDEAIKPLRAACNW
jgi:type VI secretion system protein VasI